MRTIENVDTWLDARKIIFSNIQEILNSDFNRFKSFTYKILGYQFLDTKLIINYDDCKMVYVFQYQPKDDDYENPATIQISKFYTKNYQNFDEKKLVIEKFEKDFNEDQPE